MNKKDQIGECPHCHGRSTAVIAEQILSEGWTEHKLAKNIRLLRVWQALVGEVSPVL